MFFRIMLYLVFLKLCLAQSLLEKHKEIYLLRGQLEELKREQIAQEHLEIKSGFFLGGGIGNGVFDLRDDALRRFYPIFISVSGGYQKYLEGTQAGIRTYLDYIFGAGSIELMRYFYQNLTFNFDVLGDVMLDRDQRYGLAFSGGLGFGLGGIKTQYQHLKGFDAVGFFNLGFGVILNLKHRIEFNLKIPPSKIFHTRLNSTHLYFVTYRYVF